MAYRVESGRLDKAERTPQGGLRVPAAVGRSGCLEYKRADGSVWVEYRPPEEAFSAASLASLRGAPVTDLHPSRQITAENYRTFARGHVGDDPRQDGEHCAASLYVSDAALVRGVESGARQECSAGYTTDVDETPGTAPDGTRYHAVQRNIRYNHVALGPRGWGRAGPSVGLRLDSAGNSIPPEIGEPTMKVERIDGVDYEIGSDSWAQARARFDASMAARLTALEADFAAAQKARDEAKGRADALEKELDPERLRARVQARVALERAAVGLRPELRCDGLTDRAVLLGAVGLEDKAEYTEDYLRGRFDAAVSTTARADGDLGAVRRAVAGTGTVALPADEAARARMIERNRRLSRGDKAEG